MPLNISVEQDDIINGYDSYDCIGPDTKELERLSTSVAGGTDTLEQQKK